MTTDDKTPMLKAAVEATSQAIRQALDGPSVATGRPPRASAGASLVSGEYDEAAAHHDALLRQVEQARAENARLRTELAEAREQRDHAQRWNDEARRAWAVDSAELAVVRGELAAARQETARVRSQLAEARQERDQATEALAAAESERDAARDAQRYSDLPMSERKLAWTLRQIVAGERPEAPETAPESPQTDEQTQVRGESHTEPAGTVDDALHRIALHRIADHLGIPPPWISPAETAWRALAEIDRLRTEAAMLRAEREWLADRARTMGIAEAIIAAHGPAHAVSGEAGRLRAEVKRLSALVREWEAVHADLAARCDSGDIPTRLGERYSQAVLREIDRLRTERDRLRRRLGDVLDLEELPEDHTIVAAVRRLRAALGTTPDTGSTT